MKYIQKRQGTKPENLYQVGSVTHFKHPRGATNPFSGSGAARQWCGYRAPAGAIDIEVYYFSPLLSGLLSVLYTE
jgi:hypothetical protein